MGNTLNLMQPTRRAYFVFLVKIDPSLEQGIYEIPFSISGERKHYSGTGNGRCPTRYPALCSVSVKKTDRAMFPITRKSSWTIPP